MRRVIGVRIGLGVGVGVGLGLGAGVTGCKRSPVATSVDAGAPVGIADAAAPLAPRCTAPASGQAVAGSSLEIGDAVLDGDRALIGIARTVEGVRIGSFAVVESKRDANLVIHDLGALAPDAPPPKPVVLAHERWATVSLRARSAKTRSLEVVESSHETSTWHIDVEPDASVAFDAVKDLVAWDETAGKRGVVKVARWNATSAPVVVSPTTSDADSPRIAERAGGGYVVAWIAREADEKGRDAAPEIEGPGENRSLAWIEIVLLDANGAPASAARRIAGVGSHVDSFDLQARDSAIDLLVNDDEQPSDDAGARLVLATLRGDEVTTRVLVRDSVGRGAPDLVGPWAVFADLHDKARMVELEPDARQSLEPALDDARPLAAMGPGILAGFPKDAARAFRTLACNGKDWKQ